MTGDVLPDQRPRQRNAPRSDVDEADGVCVVGLGSARYARSVQRAAATARAKAWERFARDVVSALGFGVLSLAMGLVQFEVAGVRGVLVDLREVALLIAVMHLRHWWLTIIVGVVTSIGTPPEGSLASAITMHAIGAPVAWFAHRQLVARVRNHIALGVVWAIFVIFWYLALIVPILAVTSWTFGLVSFTEIGPTYVAVVRALPYEVLTPRPPPRST